MIERSALLKDLQGELPKIESDILAYSESREDLTAHLKAEYNKAREAGRTAEHFVAWREAQITQAAVAWVLSCVFVRFLEDNGLLTEPMLAGPVESEQGKKRLDHAKQRMVAYYNENPTHEDREYLFSLFEQLEKYPVIAELLDHKHNPLWQIPVSADGAKRLIDFFQKIDAASGEIVHDFTDSDWDTRFLGDLYQDLSEAVRKRYALLQTPEFVESFILDYTLEKAKETFGLPGLRLIDPTCGSGHFLLTTFERVFEDWLKREPATNTRELAQRALDVVHGVDINPYAIAICRFRLLIAAMKAAGTNKVKDAPDFHFNLACGDSLLHGRRFEWQGQGQQTDLIDEDPVKHVLEVEDKEKLVKILGQQYHSVVGNPPYIQVKDAALNEAYRNRYLTCYRQYSLGVPFTERFFELAISEDGEQAGFMGMITTNSFMKRAFGSKLIEEYLISKDLTHVVDTSGAYIPGHGTPTVIIFGRNRLPLSHEIKTVLGIRAEPETPEVASEGKVWSSIVSQFSQSEAENDFVSVSNKERSLYSKHPWSLTGGGAVEVKQHLESVCSESLEDHIWEIGYACITKQDDIFVQEKSVLERFGLDDRDLISFGFGEQVRDWSYQTSLAAVFPYDDEVKVKDLCQAAKIINFLWPFKEVLGARKVFGGKTFKSSGRAWYQYGQIPVERFKIKECLVFPEIASHNHFIYQKSGLFNQTAPVIKLKKEADINQYLYLQSFLNSSVAGFWMKQVSHQKQLTGGNGVRIEFISKVPYQFAGTGVKAMPIPDVLLDQDSALAARMLELSKSIHELAVEYGSENAFSIINQAIEENSDISNLWKKREKRKHYLLKRMVAMQEEIDWTVYVAYGLCDEDLLCDVGDLVDFELPVGSRPFEILSQLNQDGFEVPEDIPLSCRALQDKWRQRMNIIRTNPEVRVIEDPHYKRRWVGRQGLFNKAATADTLKAGCKKWLLEHLENQYLKKIEGLISCAAVADQVRGDEAFLKIASYYKNNELFDLQQLIENLVDGESVPQFSAGRYKPKAISKFRAWQEVWGKQRDEDKIDEELGVNKSLSAIDVKNPDKVTIYNRAKQEATDKKEQVVGDIPVPPTYIAGDFRKAIYWSLRGKLDVPKERFFSLPGCEKEGDATLVIGWAGMNHLQRAQAIASWYLDRKEREGWPADKLTPMLVALDELIPWLKQWHNDIDPEFGERMGDYYEGFLLEELRQLNISRDELLDWEPPAAPKKKRAAKKKKVTAE